ncbi:aspartate/glutamate racemase family protein [Arthrobacter sp. H5]|uniref:aspartate/glutamate racemase family protein n=1 Tax=Arthrobacter sp. H5 TaxID=1267973 RepID=UPI0004B0D838|nr:aspartate/glutamate racemase family protein [Arthrobacter sp. H5]
MPQIVLIRVLSTNDPRLLNAHVQVVREAFGLDVVSYAVPDQPEGVHDADSFRSAASKVSALVLSLGGDVDGILISCSSDPGAGEARALVNIPVVGAGSAGAGTALALGSRVGVLALHSGTPAAVNRVLGDALRTVESPEGVHKTTELLTPSGVHETYRAAERLIDAGADVILQACTGLTSMGVAEQLRRRFRVPVIDAVLAAAAVLAVEVRAIDNARLLQSAR